MLITLTVATVQTAPIVLIARSNPTGRIVPAMVAGNRLEAIGVSPRADRTGPLTPTVSMIPLVERELDESEKPTGPSENRPMILHLDPGRRHIGPSPPASSASGGNSRSLTPWLRHWMRPGSIRPTSS